MQKNILNRNLIYFIILFFIVSCSSVPKYPQNACKIFGENYLWYKSTKKSSETYGVTIYIILAFINKESGFNRWAKPKRTKLYEHPRPKNKHETKQNCLMFVSREPAPRVRGGQLYRRRYCFDVRPLFVDLLDLH